MKKTSVKLNKRSLIKSIRDVIVTEQTLRLKAYAEEELNAMIESKEFHNRTSNAQDSYGWAVFYNGKRKYVGYYDNKSASTVSYLHEWSGKNSRAKKQAVNGRQAIKNQLGSYNPKTKNGWEVVWIAAAPYLGYHENGFHIGKTLYHFNVMSQRYDHIKNTLEPKCKVTFSVNPPTY